MNVPLKDRTAFDANVRNLRVALEACDGITQPIRSALAKCAHDFENGYRSAEASAAIVAGRIVCGPGPQQRHYANTFRVDLSTMEGYSPELAVLYNRLAIKAMTAVQSRLSHTVFDDDLRKHYQEAINEEEARAELAYLSFAV